MEEKKEPQLVEVEVVEASQNDGGTKNKNQKNEIVIAGGIGEKDVIIREEDLPEISEKETVFLDEYFKHFVKQEAWETAGLPGAFSRNLAGDKLLNRADIREHVQFRQQVRKSISTADDAYLLNNISKALKNMEDKNLTHTGNYAKLMELHMRHNGMLVQKSENLNINANLTYTDLIKKMEDAKRKQGSR